MATLTGSTIASTYTGLLSVSGAVGADTVEAVTDGAGTSTSLSLSQQRATITLGSGAADDFIVDSTTFVVEGDNNRVGIGTAAPSVELTIDGDTAYRNMSIATLLKSDGTNTGIMLEADSENDATVIEISGGALKFWIIDGTGDFASTDLRMSIDTNSRISLSNSDLGTGNTIFGKSAGASLDAGSNYNVFIGENVSDATMNDATYNVGVGMSALSALTTGDENVAIGQSTLLVSTTTSDCVAVGSGCLATVNSADADGTVAIGRESLTALTSGIGNVAIGYQALDAAATSDYNTAVGYQALSGVNGDGNGGNTAVGFKSGIAVTDGIYNTFLGRTAGFAVTTGDYNIAIGGETLKGVVGGHRNIAIGSNALGVADGAESDNIAIGFSTLNNANNDSTISNIAIGNYALDAIGTNAHTGEIAIGHQALSGLNTGSQNLAIGYQALMLLETGDQNIAIGRNALDACDGTESRNIAIGQGAMGAMDEGGGACDDNIAIGNDAMTSGTAAAFSGNIAIGSNALNSTGGADLTGTIAIGTSALTALTSGSQNIAIGYTALAAQTDGAANIAIGYAAMASADSGETNNIAIGYGALGNLNNGGSDQNIAIGTAAGGNMSTLGGVYNIFIGYNTGGGAWATATSNYNVAVGDYAMAGAMNGSAENTCVGYGAGNALTTGDTNVLIGHSGANAITTGYQNTCIGAATAPANEASAVNQILIGYGAVGVANNTAIIGNSSVTDVYMGDNGNAWSQTSDGRLKENVKEWNKGLDEINKLRVVEFNFKKDNPFDYNSDKKRQGIIAQEAQEVLPEMVKDDSEWLSANTEPMVWALVRAVQELSAKVKALEDAQ